MMPWDFRQDVNPPIWRGDGSIPCWLMEYNEASDLLNFIRCYEDDPSIKLHSLGLTSNGETYYESSKG